MRCLGIIPARGGSKRIPDKNLKHIAGKPLIAWTIEAANEASRLTRCVLSTDNENIAQVAIDWGAYVVRRPDEFATDEATSWAVCKHALDWMGHDYDLVALLHPTSPIRDPKHIDDAIEFLWNSEHDTLASVSYRKRTYTHNASLYLMRRTWLLANPGKHYDDNTVPFLMDRRHSVDIDDELDLKIAELFLQEAA